MGVRTPGVRPALPLSCWVTMKIFSSSCTKLGPLCNLPVHLLPENNQDQMLWGSFLGTDGAAHPCAGLASQALNPAWAPRPPAVGSDLKLERCLFFLPGSESCKAAYTISCLLGTKHCEVVQSATRALKLRWGKEGTT